MQCCDTYYLHCCHHPDLIIFPHLDLCKRFLDRSPTVYICTFASNSLAQHSSWNNPLAICQILFILHPKPALAPPFTPAIVQQGPISSDPITSLTLSTVIPLWCTPFAFLLFFKRSRHTLDPGSLHLLFLLPEMFFTLSYLLKTYLVN